MGTLIKKTDTKIHHYVCEFGINANIKKKSWDLFEKLKSTGAEVRLSPNFKDNEFHQIIEIKNTNTNKWEILMEYTRKGTECLK